MTYEILRHSYWSSMVQLSFQQQQIILLDLHLLYLPIHFEEPVLTSNLETVWFLDQQAQSIETYYYHSIQPLLKFLLIAAKDGLHDICLVCSLQATSLVCRPAISSMLSAAVFLPYPSLSLASSIHWRKLHHLNISTLYYWFVVFVAIEQIGVGAVSPLLLSCCQVCSKNFLWTHSLFVNLLTCPMDCP